MAPPCSHTHPPMSFLKSNVFGIAALKTPLMTMGQRIMQVSWLPMGRQAKERKLMPHSPREIEILFHLPFYPLDIGMCTFKYSNIHVFFFKAKITLYIEHAYSFFFH